MRTFKITQNPKEEDPVWDFYQLLFPKVSDSAPADHAPIPFAVTKRGGAGGPEISWGKSQPAKVEQPSPDAVNVARDLRVLRDDD
jgi:hypothetical protein